MSTWLITGGAGFIGSNFVRHLVAAPPARLVILDALTYAGNLATIADLIDGAQVRFVHADIRDAAAVHDVFARYDIECVVHFAAESHVDRSIVGPRAFIETNVTGTLNLLSAAQRALARRDRPPLLPARLDRRSLRRRSRRRIRRATRRAPTRRTVRTPHRKRRPTTWCAPGIALTGCPRSSPTARTTTGRGSFRRS